MSCPDITEDGTFKFILYRQDHLTKFSFLRAISNKSAETTTSKLKEIFDIIGPPTLLCIYNGREFCNKVIALFQLKHGIKMVIGKPRHSQSQGSVKRGNRDINDLIRAWQAKKNSSH